MTVIPDLCVIAFVHIAGRDLDDLSRWREVFPDRSGVARLLEDGRVVVDIGDNHGDGTAP